VGSEELGVFVAVTMSGCRDIDSTVIVLLILVSVVIGRLIDVLDVDKDHGSDVVSEMRGVVVTEDGKEIDSRPVLDVCTSGGVVLFWVD
jgi:hypothetical protein